MEPFTSHLLSLFLLLLRFPQRFFVHWTFVSFINARSRLKWLQRLLTYRPVCRWAKFNSSAWTITLKEKRRTKKKFSHSFFWFCFESHIYNIHRVKINATLFVIFLSLFFWFSMCYLFFCLKIFYQQSHVCCRFFVCVIQILQIKMDGLETVQWSNDDK